MIHDVISKILSRDSNYIVDVVMWPPNSGSSAISMRERLSLPQFYKDLTRKINFLRGTLGSSSRDWQKFYTSVEKGLNLNVWES